jgi:hypothetical protein
MHAQFYIVFVKNHYTECKANGNLSSSYNMFTSIIKFEVIDVRGFIPMYVVFIEKKKKNIPTYLLSIIYRLYDAVLRATGLR